MGRPGCEALEIEGSDRRIANPIPSNIRAALFLQAAEDKFGALHEWVAAHLADDLSLMVLARRAGMSERSFS